MTPVNHKNRANELLSSLANYETDNGSFAGLRTASRRATLVKQIISSIRRIEYISAIQSRQIAPERTDPHSVLFDPIRGASALNRKGEVDEATWLTFIGTQFGKHKDDGWKLAANVMGSFGADTVWTASRYGHSRQQFFEMLKSQRNALSDPKRSGRYSNHRQYQSKAPESIARTFQSFYEWQFSEGGIRQLLHSTHKKHGQNPATTFDFLYKSLNVVSGFGRLGKFDLLTMLGKLHILPIEAGSTYLSGATGPLAGARLLFFNDRDNSTTARQLQPRVDLLDKYLGVGKQVIEDSLCNWQKSPDVYEYFRG
ncbi:hypothetical protein [Bradyrhizobium oligotrophicum]|uniref:alpha-glutamyl/putrescinyl thymine pyrophosphorylase clade 3 protein n=1 Tax=Bradyrhizobium oligotrophicum TaxID=44255 RepID=UPI003EBC5200